MTELLLPELRLEHSSPSSNILGTKTSDIGVHLNGVNVTIATVTAWPVANLIQYIPFCTNEGFSVVRMGWNVGTGGSAGNAELGVYDESGARIGTTGSQGQGAASNITVTTNTAFSLKPFTRYYFAFTASLNTANYICATLVAGTSQCLGIMSETPGSFGLPANWTAALATSEVIPAVAISGSTIL